MAEVETLKEPVNARSMIIKVLIALALGIGIMLLPRPENLPPEGQRLLGLLVSVVFLWVSEAVPIGTTALISAAGLILLKIQNAQNAWAPFASPAVMFVMMVIMFGVVLNEVGLANRLMYYLLKFAGTKVKRLSLILAIGCTLTSTIFHDATITVIMVFAFVPVFMNMGLKPGQGHKLPMFFILLIPLASSAGGFGTLLGGGRCPLALEILYKFSGGKISIGFLQYIMIQFPICILTAVATWAILWALIRPEEKELAGVELADPGDQPGGDGHWHGHQRPARVRATGRQVSGRNQRDRLQHRQEPGRSHPGRRGVCAAFGCAQTDCGQALENLQRSAPALLRAAGRVRRD